MKKILKQPEWFSKAVAEDHVSEFIEIDGAKVHYLEW